jgi:diadenylate cyclase
VSAAKGAGDVGALVAPGAPLRDALDAIVAGHLGALVAVGDEDAVAALADGGFTLDARFTPQALYELCKMDGAVTVDASCARIVLANAHLVPDRRLPTAETGIRHRTAQQLSLATRAVVIAVSRRRGSITVYRGGRRVVLGAD